MKRKYLPRIRKRNTKIKSFVDNDIWKLEIKSLLNEIVLIIIIILYTCLRVKVLKGQDI